MKFQASFLGFFVSYGFYYKNNNVCNNFHSKNRIFHVEIREIKPSRTRVRDRWYARTRWFVRAYLTVGARVRDGLISRISTCKIRFF